MATLWEAWSCGLNPDLPHNSNIISPRMRLLIRERTKLMQMLALRPSLFLSVKSSVNSSLKLARTSGCAGRQAGTMRLSSDHACLSPFAFRQFPRRVVLYECCSLANICHFN